MRNEQGQICPYTMTFLHAGNTMKYMETFETHPILVKLLLQVDQGQQGSKPGYCMPWQCQWYPLVHRRHGISWQKSSCSHSPTNFPRYPWNVPQTLKQQFMFGKSLSFGMPGDAWGMLELDTACGNRGHGPTKCLFPDGSSTPRLGDCPDFWDISMIVIQKKRLQLEVLGIGNSQIANNKKLFRNM